MTSFFVVIISHVILFIFFVDPADELVLFVFIEFISIFLALIVSFAIFIATIIVVFVLIFLAF